MLQSSIVHYESFRNLKTKFFVVPNVQSSSWTGTITLSSNDEEEEDDPSELFPISTRLLFVVVAIASIGGEDLFSVFLRQ
mmetsp:Transcript_46041/g.46724  ORF Transcript_46041/g.46724 Transcript_46041/m.46724 type:complete len:80 (-) Transcript_46041:729-968(-)